MHRIEIPSSHIIIDFPSEIDEMTDKQFVRYVFYVLQYVKGAIDENLFKLNLTALLLNVRRGFGYFFLNPVKREQREVNLVRISELMESFIEDNLQEGKREFKLKSVRNFVPRILNYYGPGRCFENLTYCEYRLARGFFKSFAIDSKEDDLNRMIAILYRPSKPLWFLRKYFKSCDGERRMTYGSKSNPLLLKRRIAKISRVPYHIRYAVLLYFSACEDFLKTGKPVVDGFELDLSRLYTNDNDSDESKADVGMVGLLYSLTETGVFGSIEQTDNSNLWDIMIRLYQVVMQMQQMEDKYKRK